MSMPEGVLVTRNDWFPCEHCKKKVGRPYLVRLALDADSIHFESPGRKSRVPPPPGAGSVTDIRIKPAEAGEVGKDAAALSHVVEGDVVEFGDESVLAEQCAEFTLGPETSCQVRGRQQGDARPRLAKPRVQREMKAPVLWGLLAFRSADRVSQPIACATCWSPR